MYGRPAVNLLIASFLVASVSVTAEAAENGTGFYLLGSRIPGAGLTPPPGVYFQNDLYLYSGSTSRQIDLPLGNEIAAGIDASAWVNIPTFLWVTNAEFLGGQLGFIVAPPFGGQEVSAFVGPFEKDDSVTAFGDPIAAAFLGWASGNFHWQTGVMVNVPIGEYDPNRLANISFHRWAADVYGSLTWLDPTTGLEIDNSLGFTFNGENPDTDYTTGTEFHWEGAITQNFRNGFAAGLAGYYYQQISADSGPGATLGSFEGRTAAIGAILQYSFDMNGLPVTTRLKYFHEFDTKNRLPADAGYLTIAFPL